jgi:predicted membrane protein (TIGR00267 family)
MNIREFIEEYFKMSRYVALGTMDGILAVMGVTLTASGVAGAAGVEITNFAVGLTGLAGGIALAMSNAFGSFIGERAEEVRTIRELEQKMMLEEGKLDDTPFTSRPKTYLHTCSPWVSSFGFMVRLLFPSGPFPINL